MSRQPKTESKWAARIAAWRESGQSATEFAANRGYAASTLRWWAYRLARGAAVASEPAKVTTSTAPKVELVRVTRSPKDDPGLARLGATSMIEVETVRVRVAPGFDEAALRSVIAALRGAQ